MPKRIVLVLSAHFLALPMVTVAAHGKVGLHPAVLLHMSLVFTDAGLIGLWCGLAPASWRRRISFLVLVMIGLLVFLFGVEKRNIGAAEWVMRGLVTTLPAVVVFAILSWQQRSRKPLRLTRFWSTPAASEGFQFSLSFLFVVTAVVGVVLSIGKAIRVLKLDGGTAIDVLLATPVLSICLILVELATFWGSLGLGRPWPRLTVVVMAAFAIGLVPVFYFSRSLEPEKLIGWSCVTGGQSLLTAATLLVFRSFGWRLCRVTVKQPTSAGEVAVAGEDPEQTPIVDD